MDTKRYIALIVGALVTLFVFSASLIMLVFGDFFKNNEVLIYVSIAVAPLAMVSVMVGYAVWWLVLFLLALLSPQAKRPD